ncbi:MAG: protein-glutamate O-methyltransferase CheR [Proteobacteria bacterium]|nr:protein-glutamate O-methyltransferase CheR [Pseudomonadota bacterium]
MVKHKMSPAIFTEFRDFIYELCGISFADTKVYLLEDRLSRRLEEKNISSYEEYLYFLKYDPGKATELKNLYNSITTNETSFYRDLPQLTAFMEGVLPLALENKKPTDKKLRIWSAGCSTGEEPYTLAMMLMESGLMLKGWTIEILASDISDRVLRSSRSAVYGDYSIRNTPENVLRKYFTRAADGYHVNPEVRSLIRFMNINLFDSLQVRSAMNIDVIFCRNVIIYFDDDSKRKVIGHFSDRLVDNGILVLGFSETLINITRAFKPKGVNKCVVYQKL